jgi:hypothetical protein
MDVKFNVVLSVLIENLLKKHVLKNCNAFGNLGQKQGKFIPMVKTSDIKKQFISRKDWKTPMGSKIEGFIVFFLHCEIKKSLFSQISYLDFANPRFCGWSHK